ncbi:MAG: YciI family protein [Synergistaceae bacterium]|jgi:uncharacterized protein YciI|nr:YciI family protein [Synergistaceae bacterium]
MIVVIVSYIKPLEEVERFTAEHREYLGQYLASRRILLFGRRTPPVGGVILFNMKDAQEVDKIMQQDPFYVNGVSRYEIIDFTPRRFDERIAGILEEAQ